MRKNKNFWLYTIYINNKKVKVYKSKKFFDKYIDKLIDNNIDYTFNIKANY